MPRSPEKRADYQDSKESLGLVYAYKEAAPKALVLRAIAVGRIAGLIVFAIINNFDDIIPSIIPIGKLSY